MSSTGEKGDGSRGLEQSVGVEGLIAPIVVSVVAVAVVGVEALGKEARAHKEEGESSIRS